MSELNSIRMTDCSNMAIFSLLTDALNVGNSNAKENIGLHKRHEHMHKLYKEIDNSGYEDMPKEIYTSVTPCRNLKRRRT